MGLCVFVVLLLSALSAWSWGKPHIKAWVWQQIEAQVARLPVRLEPKSLGLSLWPLGVKLYSTRIVPKMPLGVEPFLLGEAHVELSWQSLLLRQPHIEALRLKQAYVIYNHKSKKNQSGLGGPEKQHNIYSLLPTKAVGSVELEAITVDVRSAGQRFRMRVEDLDATLARARDYDTEQAQSRQPGGPAPWVLEFSMRRMLLGHMDKLQAVDLAIALKAHAFADGSIQLGQLSVRRSSSSIDVKGVVACKEFSICGRDFSLDVKTYMNAGDWEPVFALANSLGVWQEQWRPWAGAFESSFQLSSGYGAKEAPAEFRPGTMPLSVPYASPAPYAIRVSHFRGEGQGLYVGDYILGRVWWSEGGLLLQGGKVKRLSMGQVTLRSHVGHGSLQKLAMDFETKGMAYVLDIKRLSSVHLTEALGLRRQKSFWGLDIASGSLRCEGQWLEALSCQVEKPLEVRDFFVKRKTLPRGILHIKQATVNGVLRLGTKSLSYEGELSLPHGTRGTSMGRVEYSRGFDLSYEGEVNFLDLPQLAGLDFEGQVGVKGRVWGNSKWAQCSLGVLAKALWFEDYFFGEFKAQVFYREGFLSFNNIAGRVLESDYSGFVWFDLRRSRMAGDVQSNNVQAEALQLLASRYVRLGFDWTGRGRLKLADLQGPMQLGRLNYAVELDMGPGRVHREAYQSLKLRLSAVHGAVRVEEAVLHSAVLPDARVVVEGAANAKGFLNLNVTTHNWRLESLGSFESNLAGRLVVKGRVGGFVLNPHFKARARILEASAAYESLEDTQLSISYQEGRWFVEGEMFKKALIGSVAYRQGVWDWDLVFTDFDLMRVLKMLRLASGVLDEQSFLLKGRARFKVRLGVVEELNMNLQKASLSDGQDVLGLKSSSMVLSFTRGQLRGRGLEWECATNRRLFLRVDSRGPHGLKKLTARLKSQWALVLMPFLSDLGGDVSLSLNFAPPLQGGVWPYLKGHAHVDGLLFRLKGLPYDFSHLKGSVAVDGRHISTQGMVRGVFALGSVEVRGGVSFKDFSSVKVDLTGQVEGSELEIPEGFWVSLSGPFGVKGDNFPYMISGDFSVLRGSLTQNLSQTLGDTAPAYSLFAKLQPEQLVPVGLDARVSIPSLPVKISAPPFLEISTHVEGILKVRGLPLEPRLTGVMEVQGGAVRYQTTDFQIANGNLYFKDAPPYNPRLNLDVNTVTVVPGLQDLSGGAAPFADELNINLLVQGTVERPELSFNSTPHFSDQDLKTYLTLGFFPYGTRSGVEAGALGPQAQARNAALRVGSAYLSHQINEYITAPLGWQIDVDSGLDSSLGQNQQLSYTLAFSRPWGSRFYTTLGRSFGKNALHFYKAQLRLQKHLFLVGSYRHGLSEGVGGAGGLGLLQNSNELDVGLEYKFEFW